MRHIFEKEIQERNLPLHIINPAIYVAEEIYTRVDDLQGTGDVTIYTTRESETMQKLIHELNLEKYNVMSLI